MGTNYFLDPPQRVNIAIDRDGTFHVFHSAARMNAWAVAADGRHGVAPANVHDHPVDVDWREGAVHICKSFTSWCHVPESYLSQRFPDSFRESATVSTVADWLNLLDALLPLGWTIRDEYGDTIPLTLFRERTGNVSVENRRRQFDAVQRDWPTLAADYWLDPDGWSFTNREFS